MHPFMGLPRLEPPYLRVSIRVTVIVGGMERDPALLEMPIPHYTYIYICIIPTQRIPVQTAAQCSFPAGAGFDDSGRRPCRQYLRHLGSGV